jgi:hypothetical protein
MNTEAADRNRVILHISGMDYANLRKFYAKSLKNMQKNEKKRKKSLKTLAF